jgi:hypothetical protein
MSQLKIWPLFLLFSKTNLDRSQQEDSAPIIHKSAFRKLFPPPSPPPKKKEGLTTKAARKLNMKFPFFEIKKSSQTLLRLEQWQERLPRTWQREPEFLNF